ncbi:arylsulfatase [Fulvivirgaceae bacterium PWU4]|uniref:Arylsulfatase n=1 Tax=Chryseosolibacter histidini TaxID=2782349 RepID=A0AAP2DMZ3_9BACT|nr:arylsulfatase [Chryseosolibacter histidini]MBT1699266.1 arylsulfatase [Chryseosolibacter histidini]
MAINTVFRRITSVYRLVALCTILFTVHVCHAQKKSGSPNIIYIMADDLGYADLGCYGQKTLRTPHLDQMAKEGARFTQFYAGSTVCAPSRCALMTGKHMGHAYVRGNKEMPLRPDDMTLAKLMKNKGYVTGMYGKWGLGLEDNTGSPEKQGWDEVLGYLHQRVAHRYNVDYLWQVNAGKLSKYPMDTNTNTHTVIIHKAKDFIRQQQHKPFFLYLPVTIPHAEMRAPTPESLAPFLKPDGSSVFDEKPFVRPPNGSYRSQPMPNAAFAAMMKQMDEDVGSILALLKELGIADNTYVFFTSDNGPHQEGGRVVEFFNSNGDLKGYKRDLYEGGIRVPMIAWAPGRIRAGTEVHEPLANWDVLPTLAELTQQKAPAGIDGLSFAAVLEGRSLKNKHDYLYWEFFERGFDQALRAGDWKIVKRKSNNSKTELYNLKDDLAESNDLATQFPDKVKALEKLMESARVDSQEFPVN